MTPRHALRLVEQHGVMLESARGPVPSLAEAVAGGPIRGSWWAHAKGRAIFRAIGFVRDSGDVIACRLVGGKVTLVHRRLWPALARVAPTLPRARTDALREEHTPSGAHRVTRMPLSRALPAAARAAARRMTLEEAWAALGLRARR